MRRYTIELVLPLPRSPDPFEYGVRIHEPGERCNVLLRFWHWENTETGKRGWVNVGVSIEPLIPLRDMTRKTATPVSPDLVEAVSLKLRRYVAVATAELDECLYHADPAASDEALELLRKMGRGRRGLSGDFYERVAAEYLELCRRGKHGAIAKLARRHKVNRSTASRWIATATERGLIPNEEES